MKRGVLLVFLAVAARGASMTSASIEVVCDDLGLLGTSLTAQGVGHVDLIAPPLPCAAASPAAQVDGLNFQVQVANLTEGGASASIHGAEWFVITGGVGEGDALFDYSIGPLGGEDPAFATTNASGPFHFTFGVPFLLTVDAGAFYSGGIGGVISGTFNGLAGVWDGAGETVPGATLETVSAPEPSFGPILFTGGLGSLLLTGITKRGRTRGRTSFRRNESGDAGTVVL